MSDVMTAPSGLGELPDLGFELHILRSTIDDIWVRYAMHPDEVRLDFDALKKEAESLNELVRDIERHQRRAA
jgi:hypothetical protein